MLIALASTGAARICKKTKKSCLEVVEVNVGDDSTLNIIFLNTFELTEAFFTVVAGRQLPLKRVHFKNCLPKQNKSKPTFSYINDRTSALWLKKPLT